MRIYILIYIFVSGLLGFEYFALSFHPELSLLIHLQNLHLLPGTIKWTTAPGRTLSLWVGWFGLGLMIIMNIYSLRKRWRPLHKMGKLSAWLNFHIFCGLLGPTLIFFHCGLKVRGIVGISFWSMIVSLSSGIIGRYFLLQVASKKNEFEQLAEQAIQRLESSFSKRNLQIDPLVKVQTIDLSLAHVGGQPGASSLNPFLALWSSVLGDFRILLREFHIPQGWPKTARAYLMSYAINKRKSQFIEPFNKLMGYWHAFHFPFAIFMYVAAVVHVISSLIFFAP